MTDLVTFLLSATGLTVLVVWPAHGPSAWVRDVVLRKVLPARVQGLLDCYVCCGFWSGAVLTWPWWLACGRMWTWFGCLMVPGIFWLVLRPFAAVDSRELNPNPEKTA